MNTAGQTIQGTYDTTHCTYSRSFVDAGNKSEGYQKFLAEGLTRSLVAADAHLANAHVEGDVGLALILGDVDEPGQSALDVSRRTGVVKVAVDVVPLELLGVVRIWIDGVEHAAGGGERAAQRSGTRSNFSSQRTTR